ncbi:UDP-N-acetylglucosamine 1-carboxyvinyltransferase [Anoxybacillus kestanbolensis]|uniref:UDP-N-acetylglucosamine 1-carboxyvinyltransferase n=1 Tax=Anoxybacillus kestanbolensis TaxID=227476 RepID=UPI003D2039B6
MIVVKGPQKVSGSVKVSGAKNSVLPIMCAALLTKEKVELENVPNLNDVKVLINIIKQLGRDVSMNGDRLILHEMEKLNYSNHVPSEASSIRYSLLLLGSLLSTSKSITLPMPGGCNFSDRPIDVHLYGLKQLGANIIEGENHLVANTIGLKGTEITLRFPSVGATENLLIASVLAEGETILRNVAREPEIDDLVKFLNELGAKITYLGPNTMKIEGVPALEKKGVTYKIIPDRIEAATFAVLGALASRDSLTIENFVVEHNLVFLNILQRIGVNFEIISPNSLKVYHSPNLVATSICTEVYPGLPTDIQPILAVLLTQAEGESIIEDSIYPTRFQYAKYLEKMGAHISLFEGGICIQGKTSLEGAEVFSSDLRGGISVLLAGLIAKGETVIKNSYQIFRGYSELSLKLEKIGAEVEEKVEEVGVLAY